MIKLIIGGIGSGKSVTLAKICSEKNNPVYINFPIRCKNAVRLREDMIVTKKKVGQKKNGDPIEKQVVNYEYWNEIAGEDFDSDILIDEAHSIASSRASMSHWNKLFNTWLSQVRKIFGQTEAHDLILATQRLGAVDVHARDLSYEVIFCRKHKTVVECMPTVTYKKGVRSLSMLPCVFIEQFIFCGANCVENFQAWEYTGAKTYTRREVFLANPYFRFYDSYKMLEFGQEVYI